MDSPVGVRLSGLVAATFTPLTPEGEIDLSVIEPYVHYLLEKQDVHNIFVNGTTGEGMSLSVEQRKSVTEEWCKKAKGKMENVIVHVGCLSLKDSQDLAGHAAEAGADGIAVIAPSFFKPSTPDALQAYLKEVASFAPDIPFYYYHLPSVTGVTLRAADVLKDIGELIPSYSGVKFSGMDLMDFGQCVHSSRPRDSLLYGMDEQLLGSLAFGANGAVGSTYNYLGSHVNNLLQEFEKGNLSKAREIQFKVQELLAFAFDLGFDLGVNKQLMVELSGLRLGPPLLPLLPCPPATAAAIAQKYKNIFLEK